MAVSGEAASRVSRFALLASGIAGRPIQVATTLDPAAYTDGATIFLPAGDVEGVAATVAVQAALLGAGSLAPDLLRSLRGRRVVDRYLTLEAARASEALRPLMPGHLIASVRPHGPADSPTSASESLRRALGPEEMPDPPAWLGTIHPRRLLGRRSSEAVPPTADDVQGRTVTMAALPELNDDEEGDESKILEILSSPLAAHGPLARFFARCFGLGRRPGEGGGGADLSVGSVRAGTGQPGSRARLAMAPPSLEGTPPPSAAAGTVYPEWDSSRGAYRPGWCRVVNLDPPPGDGVPVVPRQDQALRRAIVRVGRGLERHRRQPDGDDLDLDAVIDLRVALAAGRAGATAGATSDRVYEARLHTAPDLGVVVLLDASGSTGEGQGAGARIFDQQCQLVADLVAALEEAGDRVAACAFNSEGRQLVRVIHVKTFDERFDGGAQSRLGALEPFGYTRMGAAIRHCVELLDRSSGVRRRLLVLVSDGFPYDEDYEALHAEGDTRKALDEARRRGVACACVHLAEASDDGRLDRIFGATDHLRLTGPEELAGHAPTLFVNALRGTLIHGFQAAV